MHADPAQTSSVDPRPALRHTHGHGPSATSSLDPLAGGPSTRRHESSATARPTSSRPLPRTRVDTWPPQRPPPPLDRLPRTRVDAWPPQRPPPTFSLDRPAHAEHERVTPRDRPPSAPGRRTSFRDARTRRSAPPHADASQSVFAASARRGRVESREPNEKGCHAAPLLRWRSNPISPARVRTGRSRPRCRRLAAWGRSSA